MRLIAFLAFLILSYSQISSPSSSTCLAYATDGITCITCNTGYQLSNGCCVNCAPGYTPKNGTCVIANCLISNNNICCLNCTKGFSLTSNGFCQIASSSCATYDSHNLVCLSCLKGYTLTSLGTCLWLPFCNTYNLQTGVCTQCYPNFSYNNQSRQCESVFCIQYNSSTPATGRICSLCQPGCLYDSSNAYCIPPGCSTYILLNGTCLACSTGYLLTPSSTCTVANCQTFNADTSCAACLSGYTLVNGICKKYPYQCTQTDIQGNCLQCNPNFQLTQGQCIAVGCSSYNLATYVCFVCLPGYVLNG
jgi:hypothetical protein